MLTYVGEWGVNEEYGMMRDSRGLGVGCHTRCQRESSLTEGKSFNFPNQQFQW